MADLPDWAISLIVQRAGRGLTDDDIDRIVQSAVDASSCAFDRIATRGQEAMAEMDRPSVLYRPTLRIDGDQWCALYGDNLQDGVAGFGPSPAEACAAFDRAWHARLAAPTKEMTPGCCPGCDAGLPCCASEEPSHQPHSPPPSEPRDA